LIREIASGGALGGWNLHITFRPPPFWLTPLDIVVLEPPGSK
jgi:hypothetical protein